MDALYASLARRQPVSVAQEQLSAFYEKVRKVGDAAALRLAQGPYKKLQDEVRPVLIYAASELPATAEIKFHLSDRGRDATAWPDPYSPPILIEVTVALGKVRYRQMRALNETGIGHGFTDATDADSNEHIKARYEDYRGYSTDEVFRNLTAAIRRCVGCKSHLDCTVVIAAPLEVLPLGHWKRFMPVIAGDLPQSKCQAIFVVGKPEGHDACYRIK